MGDFSNLLHKRGGDHGSNPLSKLSPMYSSPKITGAGAAVGISSRASSFGFETTEKEPSTSPAIDYRDVFGGPPRYASSMFPSQTGSLPTLEEVFMTNTRPSPMKASTPVFELPVFEDNARGAKAYDLRPPSAVFGETHNLASPIDIARSKPSSRSGSRHMSPVHPSAYLGHQSRDEALITAGSPISRPAAGMFARRCSSSSFSSMDPVDRKPPESPFTASIAAPIGSSLPSSPFHASLRSNLGRSTGLNRNDSARLSVSSDVDDVFGGFPQRNYSQTLLNNLEPSNSASNLAACTTKAFEKSFIKGPTVECRLRGSASTFDDFETAGSADAAFCGSPFDEQGLAGDFIEINVDRRSELLAFQKGDKDRQRAWMLATDVNPQFRSSFKSSLARPPPVPISQLKVKSWKDWASELPSSQPAPSCEPSLEGTTVSAEKERHGNGDSVSAFVKDWVEAATLNLSGQQNSKNSFVQNSRRSSSDAFAIGNKIKALSGEESVELDERELQVLLAKAWKVNEEKERERKVAQQRREAYIKEKELQWKGLRKLSGRQFVASNNQQGGQVETKSSESVMDKKEWTESSTIERKMGKSPASVIDNNVSKLPAEVKEEKMELNEAVGTHRTDLNAREETCETMWKQETQVLSDAVSLCKSEIGAQGAAHIFEPSGSCMDAEGSLDISQQDFVHCIDEDELSPAEGAEDLDVSSAGFQEVEGESIERRCLRWERHIRASKRAAKALEEKQQRDAEVQREQEEKQKLAESLDCTVKRWAAGKEGNLRALLSNLQHVLWSNSGWQPIPLTGLIEGADVKKAYRKATLFVHPDKVQQKGATLQQKYIAERVFDILQEAWKTFNLQELF